MLKNRRFQKMLALVMTLVFLVSTLMTVSALADNSPLTGGPTTVGVDVTMKQLPVVTAPATEQSQTGTTPNANGSGYTQTGTDGGNNVSVSPDHDSTTPPVVDGIAPGNVTEDSQTISGGAGAGTAGADGSLTAAPGGVSQDVVDAIVDANPDLTDKIQGQVDANGGNDLDYNITVGDTTIEADKVVQEVEVSVNGEVKDAYEVTLTVDANGQNLLVPDPSSPVNVGKEVILAIDLTGSMRFDANGTSDNDYDTNTEDANISRWQVLKEALTVFVNTLHTNNPDTKITFIGYKGGDCVQVSKNIGTFNADELAASGIMQSLFGTNVTLADVYKSDFFDTMSFRPDGEPKDPTGNSGWDATLAGTDISGTNAQAGYIEVMDHINKQNELSNGAKTGEDYTVVFMTDGVSNSYYDAKNPDGTYNTSSSTPYANTNVAKKEAGNKAVEAAVELLQSGANLYNVIISPPSQAQSIDTYYDPDKKGGALNTAIANANAGLSMGDANYINGDNVASQVAGSAQEIIDAYKQIADAITKETLAASVLATQANIIDVIPAGFDVYFDDETKARVIGKDAQGNTIIEWFIGDLKDGDSFSTSYFLVPNKDYKYGAAYLSDSAILYCNPVNNGGEKVAIVLDRPAVILDGAANSDKVDSSFDGFDFNLITGGGVNSSANTQDWTVDIKQDSTAADKEQAAGTTVTDPYISGITSSMGTVTGDKDTGWTIDTPYGTVTISKDGAVAFTPVSDWDEAWGENINIEFDYELAFDVTNEEGVSTVVGKELEGSYTKSAKASITVKAPADPETPPTDPVTPPTDPVTPPTTPVTPPTTPVTPTNPVTPTTPEVDITDDTTPLAESDAEPPVVDITDDATPLAQGNDPVFDIEDDTTPLAKTSSNSSVLLWLIMAVMSMATVVALLGKLRKADK